MRISDWSSDVCSSDLSPAYFPFRSSAPMSTDPETIDPETEAASLIETCAAALEAAEELAGQARAALADHVTNNGRIERAAMEEHRSEERRVGKECVRTGRSRWWRDP